MPAYQSPWIWNDNRAQLQREALQNPAYLEAQEARRQATALPQNLASMADPYAKERDQVIRDPSGALNNSPFFKFMQEKYLNATQGKNRAGGFQNSGRGLMALGEAGQKASADYMFPYLNALGRPGAGANAFFEAYKYLNPQFIGGGGRGQRAPRQSLASMAGSGGGSPGGTLASATGLPSGGWENPYGSGMGPSGPLAGYGPTAGAGTGYWLNEDTGAGGQFAPPLDPYLDMGV